MFKLNNDFYDPSEDVSDATDASRAPKQPSPHLCSLSDLAQRRSPEGLFTAQHRQQFRLRWAAAVAWAGLNAGAGGGVPAVAAIPPCGEAAAVHWAAARTFRTN